MLKCPRCQALLPGGSAGCGKCGARFKMNRPQPPTPVEPLYIPDQATTQTSRFNPIVAYMLMLKNFATFKGRTRRRDYWGACLMNLIIVITASALMEGADISSDSYTFIMGAYSLILAVPGLSMSVRRLHDVGKSGATFILAFIPIANIYYFILTCRDSQKVANKYGSNPKEV